jgi:hypothetical protein
MRRHLASHKTGTRSADRSWYPAAAGRLGARRDPWAGSQRRSARSAAVPSSQGLAEPTHRTPHGGRSTTPAGSAEWRAGRALALGWRRRPPTAPGAGESSLCSAVVPSLVLGRRCRPGASGFDEHGYPGPVVVFSFYVQPHAGWRAHGPAVRRHVDQIMRVLHDPCVGQRLRHPPGDARTRHRWDEFCKLDLPNRLRLIYRWDADDALVIVELIGYHLGTGRSGDVYDRCKRRSTCRPATGTSRWRPNDVARALERRRARSGTRTLGRRCFGWLDGDAASGQPLPRPLGKQASAARPQ